MSACNFVSAGPIVPASASIRHRVTDAVTVFCLKFQGIFFDGRLPCCVFRRVLGDTAECRFFKAVFVVLTLVGLTGCVHLPPSATAEQIRSLQAALTQLSPDVQEKEATIVAALAYDYPRDLARQYHLVRPPLWHNLLINVGLKQRGLCYHWAEDLGAKLQALDLESIELHWGVARPGSFREHNTVVITAPHQPFTSGIVLDPWRQSGTLFWGAVTNDVYPWNEGLLAPLADMAKPATR